MNLICVVQTHLHTHIRSDRYDICYTAINHQLFTLIPLLLLFLLFILALCFVLNFLIKFVFFLSFRFCFFATFLVRIQSESNDIPIDLDKIKEHLPKNLEIPASLQNVSMPSIDELKKILKDKCAKVSGGEAAYEAIERGAEDLKACTSGLIDVEQLQKEIQEAEPHGELDTVFNK